MSESTLPQPGGTPSSKGRWLLIASLALNLLIFGAVAGAWFFGPRAGPRGWGAPPLEFGLMHFSRELPAERREQVRQALRENRPAMKPLREDLRQARSKAADVLAADDYSADKLRAALSEASAADERLRAQGVEVLIKSVGFLTPDERKQLAERWKKRVQRFERRKGKKDTDDEGVASDEKGTPAAAP